MENENLSSPLDHMAGSGKSDLVITQEIAGYLNETGKWGRFIAILGFIGTGFIILAGLFSGTMLSTMGSQADMPFPGFVIGLIYVVMGLLYFFPLYYLYNFSTNIRNAIRSGNNHELSVAFKNLKSHYKFIGILIVVMIGIYVLAIIGAIVFGAFGALGNF
ncbi:hypothetical protein JMN32_16665 [Fulvivirga sp. 29W222]|uniref:DUF5362 domain-containing protein n=1 Tax=Fulvivirga marina TaxID=2494733 RepID=A0A937G0L6_9BACT|nr:DUF5362 family protein [Fulvivirga marina]MBL6447951.1 hypothetical protein [Fulvivirga marina]